MEAFRFKEQRDEYGRSPDWTRGLVYPKGFC